MSDPFLYDELRLARKQIVRLHRQIALADLEGTVAERDDKTWRVRLEIGVDPESGEKVLSPWVKPQSVSNGAFKISPSLPAIGARMKLKSPSGIVGAASYADFGTFDDDQKKPEQQADESVITFGKTRMSFIDGKFAVSTDGDSGKAEIAFDGSNITAAVGGKGYVLDQEELRMTQKFRSKGGSRPAAYLGSQDSGGDTNIEGNDQVLV